MWSGQGCIWVSDKLVSDTFLFTINLSVKETFVTARPGLLLAALSPVAGEAQAGPGTVSTPCASGASGSVGCSSVWRRGVEDWLSNLTAGAQGQT